MTQRYVCIHGHFYQPPRESPWLGRIERQASAAPYHDWNERITAECYAPNAAARILDERGELLRTNNNYAGISFNFGPTLHADLRERAPGTDAAIREADRIGGSAMAQAFNHTILPLSALRDKQFQVHWGVKDFEQRFGRRPAGMWIPETAVDIETLEVLAAEGLRFTILAPHQAARVRPQGGEWREVTAETLDTTVAYRQQLPSGREIALFFYDGSVSGELAFGNLLDDGDRLARRLQAIVAPDAKRPGLAHVATDGETYGHHRKFGEMALAAALDRLQRDPATTLTHYVDFLDRHPPTDEVEIVPDTSWSCAHGVERWRADCGCGGHDLAWREPLRRSLTWLQSRFDEAYEQAVARNLADPWLARNDYVEVKLDDTDDRRRRFLEQHRIRELDAASVARLWQQLELQRQSQLMFTSCAWFFDDVKRIETVQIIRYAGKAILQARELGLTELEPEFLRRLARVRSNTDPETTAATLYEAHVKRREPVDGHS